MHEKARKTRSRPRPTADHLTKAVARLDPDSRRAVAGVLRCLADVVTTAPTAPSDGTRSPEPRAVRAARVPRNLTPGDNVLFCVARLYQSRGADAITMRDVRRCAEGLGLPLPATPSNTLRFAKHGGKPMFRCTEGEWHLTPQGERYLRATYGLEPSQGTAPRRAA